MKAENRRARRHSCRFHAAVRFGNKTYNAHITDLSATGMRVSVDRSVYIPARWKIEVFSEELGTVAGVVQWQRSGNLGVSMELSSNTRAKFEAAWKNFITANLTAQV